jgi:hypothetical protein
VNNRNVAQETRSSLLLPGDANPNTELNPATKRLLLGAHLALLRKRLRRGLCVEEREILALLPFTVADGSRPEGGKHELQSAPGVALDQEWWARLAEAGA